MIGDIKMMIEYNVMKDGSLERIDLVNNTAETFEARRFIVSWGDVTTDSISGADCAELLSGEPIKTRVYHCSGCHMDYETDEPIEDVATEYERNFPGHSLDDLVSLCDDCYNYAMVELGKKAAP